MKKTENIDDEIRTKTDLKVKEFIDIDPSKIDGETFSNIMNQAKMGMTFVRDREMMKRITNGQGIRVFNLVSTDKEELKGYIKSTMPKLLPD